MLDELIQPVEIDIRKKLAVEIADRQPLVGRGLEQGLMGRYSLQFAGATGIDMALGAVVKDQQLGQPARVRIGEARLQQAPEDRLVDRHEIVAHVELQIPGAALAVGRHLTDKTLQALHGGMDALPPAAGVGVMDEDPLPIGFQMIHQQMVDHPVAKVSGEDLPELGPFCNKADRRAGAVLAVL